MGKHAAYPLVQQPAILITSLSRMNQWLRFRLIFWRYLLQTSAGTPAKLRIFIIHATPPGKSQGRIPITSRPIPPKSFANSQTPITLPFTLHNLGWPANVNHLQKAPWRQAYWVEIHCGKAVAKTGYLGDGGWEDGQRGRGTKITERTVGTPPNLYVYFDLNEGCPNFPNIQVPTQNSMRQKADIKFHTDSPLALGDTVQNFGTRATWRPQFLHP